MQRFIGRIDWQQRFQDYLNQEQGTIWRITGQPGIGKSTLLRRFEYACEKIERPNIWLDMEGIAPAHGLDVLASMVGSARFFDTEKTNKTLKEKVGEGFKTASDGLVGALELSKDLLPGGGLIAGGAKILVGLGSGVAGKAALISETEAAAHPELYLLNALAATASETDKRPVCLVDTYEHLLRADLKIKSRLVLGYGQAREGQEKEIPLSAWLADVFEYLKDKGWLIVMAGRSIPRSELKDNLPRFSRTEMLEAAADRSALRDYIPTQEDAIVDVLSVLSFEGNPLWLQVAMNLLENLLAEGKDLEQLAQQPESLQTCFEEEDPFDLDAYDGIEHGRCKLALINTMTRHINGLEDQAWKIALPRVLDKGVVLQLFEPQQANAILHNFKIAGVFRNTGQQFTLHEEIRDLLLAYARNKGWLDTDDTRALHGKLWDHLNNFHLGILPPELRANVSRDGLAKVFGEKDHNAAKERITTQLSEYTPINWMLEACYHRTMSLAALADKNITPSQFWQAMAGSASLSPLEKWRIAEHLPELSEHQVSHLINVFSEELNKWRKLFGEETANALWQAQLRGRTDVLKNIEFWEQRVRDYGLAGDYYGYQSILAEYHIETHVKRLLEVIEQMLHRFADSDVPGVQEACAKALVNKGWTLGEKLNDPQGAIAAYDELLHRFADSDVPGVQEACTKALLNKGWTLREKLNDPQGAIAAYDELLHRFADSDVPGVQEACAKALVNKGITLNLSGQVVEPVANYDEMLARYHHIENPEIQELCQIALSNTIEPLLVWGQNEKAIPRIYQLLKQIDSTNQQSAIMSFLLWLAEANDTSLSEVVSAVRNLSAEVKFTWNWNDIRPLVNELPEPRKTQAECCIAFFEQHHDITILEACLADTETPEESPAS